MSERDVKKKYKYVALHFSEKRPHSLFPGQKTIGEHRVLMAEKLNRPLKRTEVVHHKDENEQNNKIVNLELLTLSKHTSLHQKGRIRTKEERDRVSLTFKGTKQTPEHIAKVRLANLGKKRSDQTRNKMKVAWTPERRIAQSIRIRKLNSLRDGKDY